MRMIPRAVAGILLLTIAGTVPGAQIEGDYLEARTADVYTGPCFSNAEVFITGHQAVMAWRVRQGSWNGVNLSGLTVAAAVRGTTTFSEDDPSQARAVLVIDEKATPRQHEALIALAKHLGGVRLENVVEVMSAPMRVTIDRQQDAMNDTTHLAGQSHQMPQAPRARFSAGDLMEVSTRPLNHDDHLCGNEVVAYAPLSQAVEVLPAYTTGHAYRGAGLDTNWSDPHCRSSFIGTFSY